MYGGKLIAEGDAVFVFASENEGGQGLIARGIVTHAKAIPKKRGIARQTPRVSVTIKRTALAKRPMGRRELKHLTDWKDGQSGLSSTSNSIGKQPTKSSVSPIERLRSSASASKCDTEIYFGRYD